MAKMKPMPEIDRQGRRFTEAARELGVDEDEVRFKTKLRKIAHADVPAEDRKKPMRKKT